LIEFVSNIAGAERWVSAAVPSLGTAVVAGARGRAGRAHLRCGAGADVTVVVGVEDRDRDGWNGVVAILRRPVIAPAAGR